MVYIIFHQTVTQSDGEGGSPSKSLLDDCHNVREVVDIRMIWQSFAAYDIVEVALGRFHDVRIPSHCEEEAT